MPVGIAFVTQTEAQTIKSADDSWFVIEAHDVTSFARDLQADVIEKSIHLVEYRASQLVIKNGDTTFVPGKMVSIFPEESEEFENYIAEKGVVHILAPNVTYSYGKMKKGFKVNMITHYGPPVLDTLLYRVTPIHDKRSFGYIPAGKTIVYPVTMKIWRNVFGQFFFKNVYQTGMVVAKADSTKLNDSLKVGAVVLKTEIITFEKEEDLTLLMYGKPVKLEYDRMYLSEKEMTVPGSDQTFTIKADKQEASRRANLWVSTSVIGVMPIVLSQTTDASLHNIVPEVVSVVNTETEKEVYKLPVAIANDDSMYVSFFENRKMTPIEQKNQDLADNAPEIYNISDGMRFDPVQSATVINWEEVPDASFYSVHILANDSITSRNSLFPEVEETHFLFQLLRPGVVYAVTVTAYGVTGDVLKVYSTSFSMTSK